MNLNFQNIFLGIMAVAVLAAIVIFANSKGDGSSGSNAIIKVSVWGDLDPDSGLSKTLIDFNQRNQKKYNVSYTYIKPSSFESALIEAIADGKSPDMVLMSNSRLLRLESKILPISYQTIPMNRFDELYIDAAKTLLSKNGALAIPLLLDPMLLYSNRDIFTNASIIDTPKYWDDIITLESKLTKRGDVTGSFDMSTIALGEYDNITHAKNIISTLFIQVGIPIVSRDSEWVPNVSLLSKTKTTGEPPVDSALRFYMDFSNPLKSLYSWNRSQPASFDAFVGEKLAMYIGTASDYRLLKEKNPHLNIKISQIPQMKGANVESTFADVIGMSVLKTSRQSQKAMSVLVAIASDTKVPETWSKSVLLPPARKDLLSKTQTDQITPYLYEAAVKSKSWIDPKPTDTDTAFKNMINGLSSGRFDTPSLAASFLSQELQTILRKVLD